MRRPASAQIDPVKHGGAALRVFINIAREWCLSVDEQMRMLAIDDRSLFDSLTSSAQSHEPIEVPLQTLYRLGCVFSAYASLRMLLPHDRDAGWLRAANDAPIFGGKSALDLMTTGKLDDLASVKIYLNGQAQGPFVDELLDVVDPNDEYAIVFVDEDGSELTTRTSK